MMDSTTSLVEAGSARAEWAAFRGFLARPRLPARAAPVRSGSLAAVLRMFGFDVLAMGALLAIAGAVMLAGLELPETALAGMEITPYLAFAVVIGAPLLEETAFRGWLSGRPGHVIALVAVAVGVFVLTQTGLARSDAAVNYRAIGVAMLTLVVAIGSLFLLRRRDAMDWFAQLFPAFFWFSTLAFACIHLLNFDQDNLWVLLPLVLPQFVLGTILGYLRVQYGLWSSILLHALHNGTALGLVYLATQMARGTG